MPPLHSIRSRLEQVAGTAWFAYGSIFLLQAKLLWGIWEHRDLSSGDTSNYFKYASGWADSLHVNTVFYPLYAVPWGSMQWLFEDPYTVTITHRILIAIGATLMVLAVLRRLLSPRIAWAAAVWWTVVPVNYDNLYELHLYSLITSLVAVLIACRWEGPRMRSTVFGVLLVNTLFMRGETVFALVVWTTVWMLYELRLREPGHRTSRAVLTRALGIPILAVAVVAAGALAADPNRADVLSRFSHKQAVNACEDYAFGYAQRHHDLTRNPSHNPLTSCGTLAEEQFGMTTPTWLEAATANPRAVAGHFAWNAELVPQGLQLMLFDGISASNYRNPDYIPVHTHSTWSLVGLIAVILFIAGGLSLLWRDRRRWWRTWIRERAWGWLALISLATSAAVVMVWERPRPAYLFALSVLILAVVGLSGMVYSDRWPALKRAGAAIPLVALTLLFVVPAHYGSGYTTPQIGRPGRPIKLMVDRLRPMRDELTGNAVKLLATYSEPGCNYIAGEDHCKPINWKPILARDPGVTVEEALRRRGVDYIYIDAQDLEDPARRTALAAAEASGWTRSAASPVGSGWLLLRPPPAWGRRRLVSGRRRPRT